jgi:hypothetical protein
MSPLTTDDFKAQYRAEFKGEIVGIGKTHRDLQCATFPQIRWFTSAIEAIRHAHYMLGVSLAKKQRVEDPGQSAEIWESSETDESARWCLWLRENNPYLPSQRGYLLMDGTLAYFGSTLQWPSRRC